MNNKYGQQTYGRTIVYKLADQAQISASLKYKREFVPKPDEQKIRRIHETIEDKSFFS